MKSEYEWRCAMCDCTIEQAMSRSKDPLLMSVDEYLSDVGGNKQFIWDRTCKNPKKTCSKACGWNYYAWLRNLDSKASYTHETFSCKLCGNSSNGGRIYISNNKKIKVCRKCARKKRGADATREWEVLNADRRAAKRLEWQRNNRKKMQQYKDRYRKKQGGTVGRRRNGAWSLKHDRCVRCKRTSIRHHARGYCHNCYRVLFSK